MTNLNPADLDWASGLLAGWKYDKPVNKWFQGQFRHAHRITRPCPTCAETIVLDVTTKALEGKATNHGLALRRCKKCRTALKAGPEAYAVRKAEVAGAPATERVEAAAKPEVVTIAPVDSAELESLRTAVATMKDELDGLYAQNKELRERLAAYELAPAIEQIAVQPVKAVIVPQLLGGAMMKTPDPVGAELLQKWLEKQKQNNAKMPWEEA